MTKQNKKKAIQVILGSVALLYGSENNDEKQGYLGDRLNQAW